MTQIRYKHNSFLVNNYLHISLNGKNRHTVQLARICQNPRCHRGQSRSRADNRGDIVSWSRCFLGGSSRPHKNAADTITVRSHRGTPWTYRGSRWTHGGSRWRFVIRQFHSRKGSLGKDITYMYTFVLFKIPLISLWYKTDVTLYVPVPLCTTPLCTTIWPFMYHIYNI